MNTLLEKITKENQLSLISYSPLFGGDINTVFKLKCEEGVFVVKLNSAQKFPSMFTAEEKGLGLLRNSNSFRIPAVSATGIVGENAYLLMEFIPEGKPDSKLPEVFAQNLAKLHQQSNEAFGLDHDNYIGSLPQYNSPKYNVSEFYISNRLEPQLSMAFDAGFHFKKSDDFYKNISSEIPSEKPSLIHGDLWSGNYMVSSKNEAVFIDPAVSYAPREMDLAMMKLFGGFPDEIFSTYNSIFPLEENWKDRIQIWQLYYLLVHLNLFGRGYYRQVRAIVDRYS